MKKCEHEEVNGEYGMSNEKIIENFKICVWDYYTKNKRNFSWRKTTNSYYIFISEIMLQQTQTHRVQKKFDDFIADFPTWQALSQANQGDVIATWQGLGYNRRAVYMHAAAKRIVNGFDCLLPCCPKTLATFPGIGINTASAICAYAFNMPVAFIETNIRKVFIHHFFVDYAVVSDSMIMEFVKKTIDKENSREWYYALMDYGVYLKKTQGNGAAKKSSHYVRQSKFIGSRRQIRGSIIRILSQASNRMLMGTILRDSVCSDVFCSVFDCIKTIEALADEKLIIIDREKDCVRL